ncbi:hypothetical protein OXYTRIMIC_547 [Oxytricha trifallax]|uniref:Uncharacterized protein n=1 Tax=Oxytricha trifallax TaxID=1172189 RepID=A0A073I0G7_9SPIT|nr:hypothetical protein OXYTRIMIC_547 [Oxytricha trifallax]
MENLKLKPIENIEVSNDSVEFSDDQIRNPENAQQDIFKVPVDLNSAADLIDEDCVLQKQDLATNSKDESQSLSDQSKDLISDHSDKIDENKEVQIKELFEKTSLISEQISSSKKNKRIKKQEQKSSAKKKKQDTKTERIASIIDGPKGELNDDGQQQIMEVIELNSTSKKVSGTTINRYGRNIMKKAVISDVVVETKKKRQVMNHSSVASQNIPIANRNFNKTQIYAKYFQNNVMTLILYHSFFQRDFSSYLSFATHQGLFHRHQLLHFRAMCELTAYNSQALQFALSFHQTHPSFVYSIISICVCSPQEQFPLLLLPQPHSFGVFFRSSALLSEQIGLSVLKNNQAILSLPLQDNELQSAYAYSGFI